MMLRFGTSLLCMLLMACNNAQAKNDSEEFQDFLEACADGQVDKVKEQLAKNPSWGSESSPEGETCLHVAGIHGELAVTKHLLSVGVDPNLASHMQEDEEEEAIQMHALSWHVFGGHLESAKLLLEHGANPNQLMDSIADEKERVTVLDMLEQLLAEEEEATSEELAPFIQMKDLLIQHGAKRRDEL